MIIYEKGTQEWNKNRFYIDQQDASVSERIVSNIMLFVKENEFKQQQQNWMKN